VTENARAQRLERRGKREHAAADPLTELTLTYSYMMPTTIATSRLWSELTNLPYANAPRTRGARRTSSAARPGRRRGMEAQASTYQEGIRRLLVVDPGSFIPPYGSWACAPTGENFGSALDAPCLPPIVGNKTIDWPTMDLYSTLGQATTVYGEPRVGLTRRYRFENSLRARRTFEICRGDRNRFAAIAFPSIAPL